MTFSHRRARRAFARYASAALAVLFTVAFLTPPAAYSQTAPKIVSVDITGNVHIPSNQILGVLLARPGETYDPKIVQADLARLNAIGFFADVSTPEIRQRPDGIAITYRVIENPVLTKITFTGNTDVPSDTLLALMDTSVGQVFNGNTFKQDVLKINSYYDKIGYGGLPTHVIDLKLDANSGTLALTIQEGFTITSVEITGDHLLPPTVILPVLTAKPGVEYSDEVETKDADALKALYDKYDFTIGNFVGGIDPTTIDLKNYTAAVKYDIDVMRVGAVQITGNTRTKDQVIRRQLRLLPGMVVTQSAIKRDYDRLNNTGYFSKVDLVPKAGPDPKKPQYVTLDWNVTETKTASAQIGFGYSGGINGEGLYGTLGYQDNNLHGTGNGVSLQFQEGARNNLTQLQLTIPYLGNTEKSQRYSFTGSIFSNRTTYYYPVYQVSSTGIAIAPSVGGTPAPVPVTLYSTGTQAEEEGVVATSQSNATGATIGLGRHLNDCYGRTLRCTTLQVGASGQRIVTSTDVPAPYYFQGGQPNVLAGPTPSPLGSDINNLNGSFGIQAESIANTNTGLPYNLYYVNFGAVSDSRDDVFNPSTGDKLTFNETISSPSFGSSFEFTQSQLDLVKFIPAKRGGGTLGIHALGELTTGSVPETSLYTFSDQQVRGYDSIFYATDALLGQLEYRQPITPDRKLYLAVFVDQLRYRIRGAAPLLDPYTNRIVGYPGDWANLGDYGIGIRFDVPQLGLHTVRIDFAKGANGTHTSFGIGQSF
jgi:outer membrane protein assembly factor BamA